MSVTITKEVEKTETLASGLKAHLDEVKKIGITEEDITKLEQTCAILRLKDEETGALRMELANKVRANHLQLAELKEQMSKCRMIIRHRYLQPEWIKYGVQDKR